MVIVLAIAAAWAALTDHHGVPEELNGDVQMEAEHTSSVIPQGTEAVGTEPKLPDETTVPVETQLPVQLSEPDIPGAPAKPDETSAPAKPDDTSAPAKPDEPKNEVVLQSISVQAAPKKTSYFVGDQLDTNGLVLKAVYSDGTSKQIKSGFTCEPMTLSSAGNREIRVTYQGKTASFGVKVEGIWSDWVTKLPEGVDASTHEIQEKTQYASSRITKWTQLTDGYEDTGEYGFYERTAYITTDSGWSEWIAEGELPARGWNPSPYYSREEKREEAIQYRYRERDIFTGEFSEYWSGWQLEEVTETEDRQVQTRNAYRVRAITIYSTRYYYQVEDGAWNNPVYGDTPIEKDNKTAVRTRTVYRYREKAE